MFYNYQKQTRYRFRRFANRAYSAFASMHKEVSIGRVCRAICDLELLKAGRTMTLCGVAMVSGFALADESPTGLTAEEMARELSLSEVLVQAKKTEETARSYRLVTSVESAQLQSLPVASVADMLTYLPGLDVRTRGNNGAQADLSLRGGTFDQVRILLNGVDLSDAHTGHYTLNLPVSQSLIERIEVLDGAVNIVTRSDSSAIRGRLSGGMYGLVNPELSIARQKGGWNYTSSIEYNRSDGFNAPDATQKETTAMQNSDYRIANLFFRAQGVVDIQFGAQYKDVGAGMYYGFGSQTQRDKTSTLFTSVSHKHQWGAWSLEANASYRVNYDYYKWWRNEPTKGANKHLTQNAAAGLTTRYVSRIGTTTFGLSARNENIFSTNLGDSLALKENGKRGITLGGRDLMVGDNRVDLNYFATQTFHYSILSASLRADGHYNSRFGNYGGGNANIGVNYVKSGVAYVNVSHTNRLPSFTDLYYKAGQQRGSRELKPEQMTTFSVGTRYRVNFDDSEKGKTSVKSADRLGSHSLEIEADGFYRLGRNIIDWVFNESDNLYYATNQNKVNGAGCEATVIYRYGEWLPCVKLSYAYTWLDLDLKATNSRYLDYLSHKLTAQVEHGICRFRKGSWLGAAWTLTYKIREGQFDEPLDTPDPTTGATSVKMDYQPTLLLDGQIYWNYRFNRLQEVRVSAACTNMTNRHYYDYGGILAPGAWAKATVSFKL